MQTKLAKWGNSLALRLPRSVALELGLEADGLVDLQIKDGDLILKPVARVYSLEELVAGITDENRHSEVDWGSAQGNEFS